MTTSPTTLHERIAAELARRTAVATAATPGPWDVHVVHPFMDGRVQVRVAPVGKPKIFDGVITGGDAQYFALHDPADALRRYAGELEVLDRHAPRTLGSFGELCDGCSIIEGTGVLRFVEWPCADLLSLASRLGVSVDG